MVERALPQVFFVTLVSVPEKLGVEKNGSFKTTERDTTERDTMNGSATVLALYSFFYA